MKYPKDLTGMHFGEWEVLQFSYRNDKGVSYFKCRCSCGVVRDVARGNLLTGDSNGCGHNSRKDQLIDLKGKTVGSIHIIEYEKDIKRWKCQCKCGKILYKRSWDLRNRKITACKSCIGKTAYIKAKETTRNLYGDYAGSHSDSPRTADQMAALDSADALLQFMLDYELIGGTISEIAEWLGISRSRASAYIHRYNLEKYVNINPPFSSEEKDVGDFIRSLGIEIIENDRKVLNGNEIDILIPSMNIGIEYNGSHWHSDRIKDKYYHQKKTIEATKKGIRIIHIFDYEWNQNRSKIKQYIRDILIKEKDIVYGRETTLEISRPTEEIKQFIDKYHLQGYTNAAVNVVLRYNGNIVSIMTFSSPRFNCNYQWELVRYVNKAGTAVIGGAKKMFSHFVNTYKPSSIVCYTDISKFRGNVYAELGFTATVKDITEPNYVWINENTGDVMSRYQTQKKTLVSKGYGSDRETESDIMSRLGYIRVYDCGNLRLSWNNSNLHCSEAYSIK